MIRVGIGGWSFAPWRKTFYPKAVKAAEALAWASRQLSAIELNATFYRTQSRTSFGRWHDETPDDFTFSVKASRFATTRKDLTTAGPAIEQFLGSGLDALRNKLGPIVWQLAPTKKFVPDELDAFLSLLPATLDGRPLQHVLDVRHDSFACAAYLALAKRRRVSTVFADSDEHPCIEQPDAKLVYARLMRTRPSVKTGYTEPQLRTWAKRARKWEATKTGRDVYVFFINGAKERAPGAALALLGLLAK